MRLLPTLLLLALAPRAAESAKPLRVPDDSDAVASAPFARGDRDLFVVQLARTSSLSDAALLESWGVRALQTIPDDAWLGRLDRAALARLADRAEVARIVWWSPGRKLGRVLRGPFSELPVRVRLAPDADPGAVARRLAELGLKTPPKAAPSRLAPAVLLPASRLAALAGDPDVVALDLDWPVTPFMDVVRSSADVPAGRGPVAGPMLDAERAWALGLRGQGQVVAVADTGLDTGDLATLHEDFGRPGDASNPSRVRAVLSVSDIDRRLPPTGWEDRWDHGTSVAAVALGNGAMSGSVPSLDIYTGSHAGMAPRAELVAECILHVDASGSGSGGFGDDPSDDLLAPAVRLGARTHSLSAGTAQDGSYSWPSDEWDQAAWENAEVTFLVAAGNAGSDGWVLPWDEGWTASCGEGWTLDLTLQPPRTGSCPFVETGSPFWTIDDRACAAPYAPGMDACLVSPPLPVDARRPPTELLLTHQADLAPDADAGTVELDADGDGTFEIVLLRVTGSHPYEDVVVPIPPAAWSSASRLRFRFTSDGSGEGYGWLVHAVQLADGVVDGATVASPATAKNVVTVGASENVRPGARSDVTQGDCADDGIWNEPREPLASDHSADDGFGMAAFSSRGPARDGRIKPDVVAPGTFLLTARSRVAGWLGTCGIDPAERADHGWFGGTSGATPIVAGAAALVRQALAEGRHGRGSLLPLGPPDAMKSFEPSGALVKALLLDGAASMGRGQYPPPFEEIPAESPNRVNGHGRLDVMGALDPAMAWGADPRLRRLILDERAGLRTGESREHGFTIAASDVPLRVRLAWTDPPASAAASVALVNDLDVAIRLADGTTIPLRDDPQGNVNGGTLPAGSCPEGPASVVVSGARVPGQVGFPGSDAQAYALVVTGAISCAAPAPVTGLRVSVAGNDVVLTWDSRPDAVAHAVFDVDETSLFATRAEIGSPPGAAFTHAGVRRDGTFRCWLVSSRNECGDLSAD